MNRRTLIDAPRQRARCIMSLMGQRRRSQRVRDESAYPTIATGEQTSQLVGSVPTASFWALRSDVRLFAQYDQTGDPPRRSKSATSSLAVARSITWSARSRNDSGMVRSRV
jgi:hypothetical protein